MAGPDEAQPARGFGPAPEVMAYFDGKQLAPRFSWLDVWGEEHASAFTVAKATELELLTTFRDSIRTALEKGQGFDTWKAGIEPELKRLGWWGKRTVIDPTGQDKPRMVDFSAPRRLKNMFWSNMNSARAAGQWDRIQRTKRALPYLLYVRTTAAEPRQEHLAWVGVILPADDPFWRTHFPPNGWGCKCTVRQITRRERERLLSSASEAKFYSAERPVIDLRPFVNRRTGEVTYVPEGIDPGWQTNSGLARSTAVTNKLRTEIEALGRTEAADAPAARKAIEEVWQSEVPMDLALKREPAPLPAAIVPDLAKALDARSAVVAVSPRTMATKITKHEGVELSDFAKVQTIVDNGTVIDRRAEGGGITFWMRSEEDERTVLVAAIKVSADGYLYVSTLFRSSGNRMKSLLERLGEWRWRGE